jgi:hypothetical protein
MPSYRVDFLNEFARGDRVHKVCQRSIFVGAAESPESARAAAIKRFAELENIPDWRIHAAIIEILPIVSQPKPQGEARSARGKRALVGH